MCQPTANNIDNHDQYVDCSNATINILEINITNVDYDGQPEWM